jgi:hypothetical protein
MHLRNASLALPLAFVVIAACSKNTNHGTGSTTTTTGTGGHDIGPASSSSSPSSSSSGSGGSTGSTGGAGGGGTGGGAASSSSTAASSSGMVQTPACPCYAGDGQYCQTAAESYATAHGCSVGTFTSSDLLTCSKGSWSLDMTCPGACLVNPGKADTCAPSCNALNLQAFISKFTGMCTGFPGWSPSNQCTDLALQWVENLCLPIQFSGNAINWAGENAQGFQWVPNAPGIVPSPGDLVVFGPVGMTCNDGVGAAGHVDVCVSADVNSTKWQGFDQNWQTNWNGTCYPPQLVNHNWSECVIGWQHLTIPLPP